MEQFFFILIYATAFIGTFFYMFFFFKIEDTKFFIIPLFNIVWQVGIFGLEFVIDSDAQVSNTVLGPHFIIIMMSYKYVQCTT